MSESPQSEPDAPKIELGRTAITLECGHHPFEDGVEAPLEYDDEGYPIALLRCRVCGRLSVPPYITASNATTLPL